MMFRFGEYTLDVVCGCLRTADREIELRPKSFEVLRYLVENAGRLVTKDELIKTVWRNVVVTDESLMQCVSEVRHAITDAGQAIIKTVPRRGYRFIAPVLRVAANAAVASHQHYQQQIRRRLGPMPVRDRNRRSIGPPSRCCPSQT
jgi:DNA-binding winged helix-turn-helix (wHTH) protein